MMRGLMFAGLFIDAAIDAGNRRIQLPFTIMHRPIRDCTGTERFLLPPRPEPEF